MARPRKTKPKAETTKEETSPEQQDIADRLRKDRQWVTRAKRTRTEWENRFRIKELERYFLGEQWENEGDKDLTVVLNHLSASIDTDLPNLFYQTPKWFVRPTARSAPEVELRARIAEATLETVANQDQCLKLAGKLAVLQAFWRCGVIEAIYDPTLIDNPEAGQPVAKTGPDGKPMTYPAFLPSAPPAPDPMTGVSPPPVPPVPHPMAGEIVPMVGKDGKPMTQPSKIYADDAFRFEWVDAALLLLDPDGGPDPSKWRLIGKEVVMPLEEAKENEQFADWRRELEATEWSTKRRSEDNTTEPTPTPDQKVSEGYVRLYVLYDIRERRMRVIADAQKKTDEYLLDTETTSGIEDHPFGILSYTPILGPEPSPWPKPLIFDWLGPQKDYNTARWLVQEHAKRNLPKEVYDSDTFADETEIVKYTSGGPGVLAKVNTTKSPPIPIQKPPLNDAIVRWIPMAQSDWRIITGQTGARLSAPAEGTATEASFAERSGNLRDSQKQDTINDWLSRLGWKMLKLLRKNMTFKFWVKLRGYTNEDVQQWLTARGVQPAVVQQIPGIYDLILKLLGGSKWEEVSQEELDFDAEVTVVPGTARARNLELERQQWVQFLQIIGQAPQLLMSRELIKATAEKFETINDRMVDELYAMSQKMLAAKTQVAGHAAPGDNGGGAATPQGMPPVGMESPLIRLAMQAAQKPAGG